MDCREWRDEISECARRGGTPSARLEAHLFDCQQCSERWNAEKRLGETMGRLRLAFAGERSPAFRRSQLMEEFARTRTVPRRLLWFRWAGAGAVAVALLVWAAVLVWRSGPGVTETAGGDEIILFGEEGFVPVPYTPPLAAGESVWIVHRQIQGVELARMGIEIPGGYISEFDADIALGDDGWPRAVRVNSEIFEESD